MEFVKKKYIFRGMDGYAGFRSGQDYELELGQSEDGEIIIVNPVSRLWMYCSKADFTLRWEKVR